MRDDGFARLALLAVALILRGASVRVVDAGLGWPGCYGRVTVSTDSEAMAAAMAAFPNRQVTHPKARKELLDRCLAGTPRRPAILGVLVTALGPAPARATSLLAGPTGRYRPDVVMRDA
jgi:heme A synthase